MNDNIKTAFDCIRAEDELKSKTIIFLQNEIEKRDKTRRRIISERFAVIIACFAAIFLSGIFSYNIYFTPAAYVDVDVNPSIELSINRFSRVIGASPYNDEGEVILRNVNLRHKSYDEVIQALLGEMITQNFLNQDGLVSVTVQADDIETERKLLENLQTAASGYLISHHSTAATDVFAVSREIKNNAHDYNLSPAKYIVITELMEVDSTATVESCRNHSIVEIRQLTQAHKGSHHNQNNDETSVTENKNVHGNNHGKGH